MPKQAQRLHGELKEGPLIVLDEHAVRKRLDCLIDCLWVLSDHCMRLEGLCDTCSSDLDMTQKGCRYLAHCQGCTKATTPLRSLDFECDARD